MKPLTAPQKSAKQFMLQLVPSVLSLFDVPQTIYGFSVENEARKRVYAMSEESARRKLDALKELLQAW